MTADYKWIPDNQWRPVVGEKQCRLIMDRRQVCKARAVAELDRNRDEQRKPKWYAYCVDLPAPPYP